MNFKVTDSVLNETTKCLSDFSCLSSGQCCGIPQCKVEAAIGENVLSLESIGNKNCPYFVSFGGGELCICPIFNALYRHRMIDAKSGKNK